jgi:hypothetical protein
LEKFMATDETRQRLQFGGFNTSAAFFGWIVATGVGVLLAALLSAVAAAIGLSQKPATVTNNLGAVGIGSAIAFVVVLAVSYYAGGYVAGRMSRFDGGRQGFGVWVMSVIITLALAAAGVLLGANFNLAANLDMPRLPLSGQQLTTGGLVTLLLALAVSLIAAVAGGKVGRGYHRRVDMSGVTSELEDQRTMSRTENDPLPQQRPMFGTRTQPTFGERIGQRSDRNAEGPVERRDGRMGSEDRSDTRSRRSRRW